MTVRERLVTPAGTMNTSPPGLVKLTVVVGLPVAAVAAPAVAPMPINTPPASNAIRRTPSLPSGHVRALR